MVEYSSKVLVYISIERDYQLYCKIIIRFSHNPILYSCTSLLEFVFYFLNHYQRTITIALVILFIVPQFSHY